MAIIVALLSVIGGTAAGTAWYVDRNEGTSAAPAPPSTTPTVPPTEDPSPEATAETTTATPTGDDFAATYERVESGVMRVLASTCEGDGIGTAFVVDRHTLATAAHVIDGATAIAVEGPSRSYEGTVTGVDPTLDLALIQVSARLPGHVFTLADDDPQPGTAVAAIGFPLDEPKTLTLGTVSGLDRTIRIDGVDRSGLLQTDVAINPGNSGGPLVSADGAVVGVVDAKRRRSQGIGYAVQVSAAEDAIERQVGLELPLEPSCGITEAPAGLTVSPRLLVPPSLAATAIRETLADYYDAINTGRYDLVVDQYAPGFASRFDAESLAENLSTSFDFSVVIREVSGDTDGAEAWVTFVSVQSPQYGPDGEGCTSWSLDYRFVPSAGRLLISDVAAHSGDGHEPC